jgi:hypothetical protein
VDLVVVDRKDRSAFEARVVCPNGGEVYLTSSESSASSVLAAQAQAIQELASTVAATAMRATLP